MWASCQRRRWRSGGNAGEPLGGTVSSAMCSALN
jgi:hypothetical protein